MILMLSAQIDPKRAIPRDEQEKTSKIFVGGVSQEATESDFREYFTQFGRVLDATLMMDKDTGRPRGFGFVTFDSEAAVENALACPTLEIMGKAVCMTFASGWIHRRTNKVPR
jgi:RNA-binding protein Musashi